MILSGLFELKSDMPEHEIDVLAMSDFDRVASMFDGWDVNMIKDYVGINESKASEYEDQMYQTIVPQTPEEHEEYEKKHGHRFGFVDYDVFLDEDDIHDQNVPRPDIHGRQVESVLGQDRGRAVWRHADGDSRHAESRVRDRQ